MKRIVLLSCSSKKSSSPAKARYLYNSYHFQLSLKYTEKVLKPDKIFILSAKHGLVGLDQHLEPYDKTLKDMNSKQRKAWAKHVLVKLEKVSDLENDEFFILAGNLYKKYLVTSLAHVAGTHIEHLRIGMQNQFFKKKLNGRNS